MIALAAPLVVVAAAIVGFVRLARGSGVARFGVAAAMAMGVVPGVAAWRPIAPPAPALRAPATTEYVSSAACQSCHPSEYASWHDSYHRTMTQAARGRAILAPIDGVVDLTLDGRAWSLRRDGDDVWASPPDGGARRVALTTGSHHYQAYWTEHPLAMLPFVYLLDERRWIPRREAFVQPPGRDAPVHFESNCIQCHTTAGSPGYDAVEERLDPAAAELGIACEACHGPGAAHVARHANPIERYVTYAKATADPTIVNPSRLSAERASMICGACHAYTYPRDEADFWAHGYGESYRPGQDLAAARILLTADALSRPASPALSAAKEDLFYDDGTVRIGGREYNGMALSACFARGHGDRQLSCLSCHSMHDSAPDDQLARGKTGDAACAPCHEPARFASASHTHHGGSPASRQGEEIPGCMGCHMPMTAYALLGSIRSHRIDSPRAEGLAASDRPNACNLCHLDRSLAWTRAHLEAWYGGRAGASLDADPEGDVPAGAAWLLAGDPGQRAIAASAMATPGARAALGDRGWQAPLLRAATGDPYAAIALIAARSLRALPGSGPDRGADRALVDRLVAARSTRALTLSE